MYGDNNHGPGKRSAPSTNRWNNDNRSNDYTKKRDRRDLNNSSSLTRETELVGGIPVDHVPKDGEFESFPEVPEKTREVLRAKGYKNLFPI